jgi:phosphate transport system ATP-binding protein
MNATDPTTTETVRPSPRLETRAFSLFYGKLQALKQVTLEALPNTITAIIGPSGCGKSTLLRAFNRMNDLITGVRTEGTIRVADLDVLAPATDVVELRRRVGMVFQRPNPFPKTIFENVVFGLRMLGLKSRSELEARAEASLRSAALWDEVKDRLQRSALQLSGGQQQRLCIARCLAVEPEVLLMDEPASALDPSATARIEELVLDLKSRHKIDVDRIERIEVGMTRYTYDKLAYLEPKTGLEAKFSMPFTVAWALVHPQVTLDTFTDAAVKQPKVQALLRRAHRSRGAADGGHAHRFTVLPHARVFDDAAPTLQLATHDLPGVLATLYARDVQHVLLEGGPTLAGAFVAAGLVDRVVTYLAPVLLGAGPAVLGAAGITTISAALRVRTQDVTRLGEDVRITALVTELAKNGEEA